MRIRKIAFWFTALMVVFLLVFLELNSLSKYQSRDIVKYNDLLYKVEEDLEAGADVEEVEDKYDCTIVMSKRLDDPDLAYLYKNEAMVLDLEINGEYVGKVGWLDIKNKIDQIGMGYLRASVTMWVAVLLAVYIILFFIYLGFIRPTKDLKNFSTELAKGNLDVALPIRRFNPFGGFTEAFDIMREELKTSQKQRIDSEIARKELVSGLSHDIKTPVAVIEATCEVLDAKFTRELNKPDSPYLPEDIRDVTDKIGTISAKAHTISTLMTDIMHSGLEESEKALVKPVEEYTQVIEDYFVRLKNYGNIIIKNHIPQCLVYMDRQRMEQVIDNIVGNSHKYAGTDITVSFDEVNGIMMPDGSKAAFVGITISDEGPGVDEEDLPLIAQKYYRGSNAKEGSGYGLGMYLVKLYMQRQGGDMEYYNDNGFTVRLLLRKV